MVTVEEPGVQDPSEGWQGCGVNVPLAALVAAATCGFDIDVHIPNGGTFCELVSPTAPAAAVAVTSELEAENVDGVVPNEHCSDAPVLTWLGIRRSFVARREHNRCWTVRKGPEEACGG